MMKLQPFIFELHHKLNVLINKFLRKYLPRDDEKEDSWATKLGHLHSSFQLFSFQLNFVGKQCLKMGKPQNHKILHILVV